MHSSSVLTFFLMLTGTFFCSGAESSLKVTIPHNELRETPEIKVDKSNLRIEDSFAVPGTKKKKAAPDSLAARLGEPEKDIHWKPAWNSIGSGSLRLHDTISSPDRSVLLCLEETGTPEEGPYGGRLLLLDIPGNRILRVMESGRKIVRVGIDEKNMRAVCFAEAQSLLNQPAGFVVIDLKTGKETEFHPAEKPFSYALDNNRIYSSFPNSSVVQVLTLTNGKKKTFHSGKTALLEFSGDKKSLIAASDDAIRFYDPDSYKLTRSVKLPSGTKIYRLIQGNPDASMVFVSTKADFEKSKVFLIIGSAIKEVSNDSSGEIMYNPKDKTFFCGRFLQNRFYKIDPVTFDELAYCDPKNLRPATSGKIRELFCGPDPGEIIIQDSRGALYFLKSDRKRWQKTMIVESGMR